MVNSRGDYNNHRGAVGCVNVGRGGDVKNKLKEFERYLQNKIKLQKILNISSMENGVYDKHNIGQEVLTCDILKEFHQLFKSKLESKL